MKNVFASSIFLASCLSTSVMAHGFVSSMVIGGKTYTGPSPYGSSKAATPIRKITTVNPINDVNSGDITCGIGAKVGTASIIAPATAGSKVTFQWKSGVGNWGHSVGPLITYLAKCDGPCENFDPKNADFFKISETGRKPNSLSWYQEDIKKGGAYTTTIPAHVPNGDYIMRHEIIALHFATEMNGAQFYPSCSQIRISGGSNAASLKAATTASPARFPGAYHANDKGIYTPNVYTDKSYVFPGPSVATFSSSGVTDGNSTTPISSAAPSSSTHSLRVTASPPIVIIPTAALPVSATSATPSPTAKTCNKKHNKRSRHAARRAAMQAAELELNK